MTESIRNIFDQNIGLLGDMDKAVLYFREQQYEKALGLVAGAIDKVRFVIEAIIADQEYFNLVTTGILLDMLSGILEAKKNQDFILLADLLDLQLINFLVGVQELIISKEEILFNENSYQENINSLIRYGTGFTEELLEPVDTATLLESGYRVEFTSGGQMTLAAENDGQTFYFHTNSKVTSEAFALARRWFRENTSTYVIYGFGMGYHISELLKLDLTAGIEIYEADRNVMQLACAFTGVRELLEDKRIKLVYDPEFEKLKERVAALSSNESFLLHYPSYRNVRNPQGKELFLGTFPWIRSVEAC